MPNPLNGNLVNLYLDMSQTAVPDWKMVACLTDYNFDGSGDVIDASSKCGQAKLAGENEDSSDFTGFFELQPSATQVSMNDLMAVYQSKESRHWKASTVDGVAYYREFNGPLTSYSESAPYNGACEFNGTISHNGSIITVPPAP